MFKVFCNADHVIPFFSRGFVTFDKMEAADQAIAEVIILNSSNIIQPFFSTKYIHCRSYKPPEQSVLLKAFLIFLYLTSVRKHSLTK
jgi:hypothetical protein